MATLSIRSPIMKITRICFSKELALLRFSRRSNIVYVFPASILSSGVARIDIVYHEQKDRLGLKGYESGNTIQVEL
jgi:hypothetical protein